MRFVCHILTFSTLLRCFSTPFSCFYPLIRINGWILYPDSYGISPETFMDPPYEFENCERNAYELARYHSQVEWLVGNSHRRFQDAQALTFGKLLDVFNQMSAR